AWQNYDGGAGKIVRAASITETSAGTEMRVELRSGPLGPVEVHAMVRGGAVGAEIHVHAPEAHSTLSAAIPSLERSLAERNLRVENISVYQNPSEGMTGGGAGRESQSESSPSHQPQPFEGNNAVSTNNGNNDVSNEREPEAATSGLNVRA